MAFSGLWADPAREGSGIDYMTTGLKSICYAGAPEGVAVRAESCHLLLIIGGKVHLSGNGRYVPVLRSTRVRGQ